MTNPSNELEGVLWIVLGVGNNQVGVCGVFSSEEVALKHIDYMHGFLPDMECWVCPTDVDVLVGTTDDRFADMPDRVWRAGEYEVELEKPSAVAPLPVTSHKAPPVNRKGLKVVK